MSPSWPVSSLDYWIRVFKLTDMYHQWKGGGAGGVIGVDYKLALGYKYWSGATRLAGVYKIYLMNRSHTNLCISIHGTNGRAYMKIHGLVDCMLANPGVQARVYCYNKTQQICLLHNYNMTFQFRPVNVSILALKCEYGSRSEGHFAGLSHCNVTWYPLTTGMVVSQCPSWRDSVLVMWYLTPLISAF